MDSTSTSTTTTTTTTITTNTPAAPRTTPSVPSSPATSPTEFAPAPLSRSVSQQSGSSLRSSRSHRSRRTGISTHRSRKRISQTSSYASSIAASDKSLTSFPSFSPGSPDEDHHFQGRPFFPATTPATVATTDPEYDSLSSSISKRLQLHLGAQRSSSALTTPTSRPAFADALAAAGIPSSMAAAEHASATSPPSLDSASLRDALFDDAPLVSANILGALHRAGDAHIERLVVRHGAVGLTRLLVEDLARRDAQVAALRRRAEARERALRKIILECGLSNLELETRLRAVEAETRIGATAKPRRELGETDSGISDLVSDAMGEEVGPATWMEDAPGTEATIRARGFVGDSISQAPDASKGGVRGWKDYLWAKATGSRASSVNGDATRYPTVVKAPSAGDKRPGLGDDLFNPPRDDPAGSPSRSSSVAPTLSGRKSSLALMALRLVAGGVISSRDGEPGAPRGRASSGAAADNDDARSRSTSMAFRSGRTASAQGGPKALMAMRRAPPTSAPTPATTRTPVGERWDTMVGSPLGASASRKETYGPVEMDTIRPAEAQPPTLTHVYSNSPNSEFLTDRFGFIYDQRRKKREREAAQMARQLKQGGRAEMLGGARSSGGNANGLLADSPSLRSETPSGDRPGTPESLEDHVEGLRGKRWQDHLKAATFPTELLSHTPGTNTRLLEVTEGSGSGSGTETPRSPGLITGERGFLPPASTTSALDSETVALVEGDAATGMLVKEETEPIRLLLQQLNDVHDSLQRDRTVKWNDFMRKVRAERRREGEAEAAAAVAAAEARFEQPVLILPEAKLHDGEMIGIADLGNKGKVGRAKWNEFKALVLGGIPVAYRPKVWAECSGAMTLRIPGYYDHIISRPTTEDDSAVVGQIEMDIRRTLTDNIFFRKGPGVEQLKSVLFAYARRNPEVGYCQGMNLIAANLLLVMPSAEDAFWILASIIENILPPGYHDDSLLTSRADQQVLRYYVSTVLPRLSRHLDTLGIELEALTFQWFLSVFTDLLSAEALFRVWDVVLCMGTDGGGATFLFRVALALLKLNEAQLLRCDSPAAAYTYINHQMTNHAISIDGLIHAGEALRKVVKRGDVEARRETAVAQEKDNVRMRSEEGFRPTRNRVASGASSTASMTSASGSGDLVVRDPLPMDQEEIVA